MHDTNMRIASKKLYYLVGTVISKDLKTMHNLTSNMVNNALRLIKFFSREIFW